ncbi:MULTISPECIES: hypothetical protein [Pseudoalteromonas]|uniref:Uncharacterized protein n=1 Tax=Pseudoalteromonas amylolytica TaxID=1859457 RepID=A0A1S1MWW7_9GAMM|nr:MULTISPECIES: hypothetical protein [Pseudoalteromonas]OHU85152.1 hypothetical protein BFC16_21000 [Pseudoalteromonas sp. JW3]OHU89897.1 hypothetical protein BET10_13975 [Pseudoalteromonas amylolytica]
MTEISTKKLLNDLESGLGDKICNRCDDEDFDYSQAVQDVAVAYTRKLSKNYNSNIVNTKGAQSDLINIEEQELVVRGFGDANPAEMYMRKSVEFLRVNTAYAVHLSIREKNLVLALLQYQENLTNDHIANAFHTLKLLAIGDIMSEEVKRRIFLGLSIPAAILGAISFTGAGLVIALVAGVVAPLIVWYAIKSSRDFLGLVVNFSSTNLICQNFTSNNGDLYMWAGKMDEFPRDKLPGVNAKEVTIRGLDNGFDDEGNDVEFAFVAQVYATKKIGFFGAEGAFSLRPLDRSQPILTSVFSSPYSSPGGVYLTTGYAGSALSSNWDSFRKRAIGNRQNRLSSNGIKAEFDADLSQDKKVFAKLIINEFQNS